MEEVRVFGSRGQRKNAREAAMKVPRIYSEVKVAELAWISTERESADIDPAMGFI